MTSAPTLFHFSEEPDISLFTPQPLAADPASEVLVWAIDRKHAPNYYFPRDCPRITFSIGEATTDEDAEIFFRHTSAWRVVAIESGWLERVRATQLYRYYLPSDGFVLKDAGAGYYISTGAVKPLHVEKMNDLLTELIAADVELRVMPSLWKLYDAVAASTLEFSIIRMRNAMAREA
jgi:hypothetical protein